jgi:predicted metal-dependent hydrolase
MSDSSWLQNISKNMFSALSNIQTSAYPTVSVKSSVDGNTYLVRDMPDKQEAADLLARVRQRMQKLYNYLIATYPEKLQVKQLRQNFKPDPSRISESTPDAEHTSYSVNKGESVHLCLRQRQGNNESLVKENVMTFVALHEMSHMITPTVGHGPDFWNNFGWLLKIAEDQGIYTYEDFSAHPVSYCGVKITDSPKYDSKKDASSFVIGTISE